MVRAEVAALRKSSLHRSISEIYDFYEAPTVFYIVMEFVDGGELLDHLVDVGAAWFGLYTIFSIFYIRFWDLSTTKIFEYFSNIEGFGGEYSNIFRI